MLEPALADYYKGEAFVIAEEFSLSLVELPNVPSHALRGLAFLARKLANLAESMNTWVETTAIFHGVTGLQIEKKSFLQCGLIMRYTDTLQFIEQVRLSVDTNCSTLPARWRAPR